MHAVREASQRRLALAREYAEEGYRPEVIAAMAGYSSRDQARRAAKDSGDEELAAALRLPTRMEKRQHILEDFEFLMESGTWVYEALERVGLPTDLRKAQALIRTWDGSERVYKWLREPDVEWMARMQENMAARYVA